MKVTLYLGTAEQHKYTVLGNNRREIINRLRQIIRPDFLFKSTERSLKFHKLEVSKGYPAKSRRYQLKSQKATKALIIFE